ncbi:MAG: family 1 glycosylhydrolase [Candidatus Melainabacteria bacterium]|nr:family 1 glycosylhydrolase [Candidatus Melainabacteria bacterium]
MTSTRKTSLNFPNKFYWGTATAAFQIEGHPEETLGKLSDWSEWIEREDKVLRPTNDGKAVAHYEHMMEDVELIRGLNSNAYRFSFNWARLHRGPGEFDENTAKFYDSLLDQLLQDKAGVERKSRVEPFATIVHFTIPSWLAKEGGWENPNTAYEFQKFTEFLAKRYGDRIKFWVTHNEPNIFLGFGYESGIWPPGYQNDWNRYFKAYQGLLLGHQLAYKTIKSVNSDAQVGFAQNLYAYEALDEALCDHKWQSIDAMPNALRKQLHNYAFIESCIELDTLDFLGVNYYTRFSYTLNPQAKDAADSKVDSSFWGELAKRGDAPANGLGWELYAEGLYKVLTEKKLSRMLEGRPIYITENGYSHIEETEQDIEDKYRVKFIRDHLIAVHRAINEGANVRGYFYWSLLDNFEWALGMKPRFGLVHVDHASFVRTKKQSYDYYAEIALNNALLGTVHKV